MKRTNAVVFATVHSRNWTLKHGEATFLDLPPFHVVFLLSVFFYRFSLGINGENYPQERRRNRTAECSLLYTASKFFPKEITGSRREWTSCHIRLTIRDCELITRSILVACYYGLLLRLATVFNATFLRDNIW